MRLNLGKFWQSHLAKLPESSMGAQHVDIHLKSGRVLRNVTVFNGEDCEIKEAFDLKEIVKILLHKK